MSKTMIFLFLCVYFVPIWFIVRRWKGERLVVVCRFSSAFEEANSNIKCGWKLQGLLENRRCFKAEKHNEKKELIKYFEFV